MRGALAVELQAPAGKIEQQADENIHQARQAHGAAHPAAILAQEDFSPFSAILKRLAKHVDDLRAQGGSAFGVFDHLANRSSWRASAMTSMILSS